MLRNAQFIDAYACDASFREAYLHGARFNGANLAGSLFNEATLHAVRFSGANLVRANFFSAVLDSADFSNADLSDASFKAASLLGAMFRDTSLSRTDFEYAVLSETAFVDTDLSCVSAIESCFYRGPSILDHRTLQKSRNLPLAFLRGCGLPDRLINYLPSLLNDPIQFYSCFISHASVDEEFVKRLYDTLQGEGVRCWYAPEDFKTGDRLWDTIDAAIRHHDKLLLVLSEQSLQSDWVEAEVSKAYAEERRRRKRTGNKQTVLFPVRIDDAVMDTEEPWAVRLRDDRHIGDFRNWKDHDGFQKAFDRILCDLKGQ